MNKESNPLLLATFAILLLSTGVYFFTQIDRVPAVVNTLTPITQTAAVADFDSSLIAHYTFDEGNGETAVDRVGGNSGALTGATWVSGKVGSYAVHLDGVSGKMTPLSDAVLSPGSGNMTISMWIKPDSVSGSYIYTDMGPNGDGISVRILSGNRIGFSFNGNGAVVETLGDLNSISAGQWYHVVGIKDGGTATLYINGVKIKTLSNSNITSVTTSGGWKALFGAYVTNTNFFPGILDDIRIYNKALSQDEVVQLYTEVSGTPPTTTTTTGGSATDTGNTTGSTNTGTNTNTNTGTNTTSTATRSGNIVAAASCSQEHVQDAINSSQDGDIVQIPSGTCTWNKMVSAKFENPARSVIIQGAGIDKTVIVDEVPTSNTQAPLFLISTIQGKAFRMTGLTVQSSPNMTTAAYGGAIIISGTSKQVRLDHIRVNITHRNQIAFNFFGDIYAVVDHVTIDGASQTIRVWHDKWNDKTWGDGSWSSPLSLGTEKAVYIEDSMIRGRVVTDAYGGGRYVVRHNTIETTAIPIQNHGTESGGRIRGTFSWEIYNNTVKLASSHVLFHMRSGTGVIFNNTMTGVGYLGNIGTLNNYRNADPFNPWGACDGRSPYDKNDGVVYDTGTQAAGINSSEPVLTVTGKNWTTNQWVGYSIVNVTKGWGSDITGNTANTITAKKSVYSSARGWDSGDTYQILRVDACIDQVGRSTGDLISSDYNNPQPKAWPNQALEPVYLWGNTLNGVVSNKAAPTSYVIKKNRDFIEDTPRPGYTPYTYPHPFTTSGFTGDDPSRPLPPPASPAPLTPQTESLICTSFTYSAWGTCTSGTQYRTITSSSPNGCTGGAPILSQSCTTSTVLVGDFDGDGLVTVVDFSLLAGDWNKPNSPYDLNSDGIVNTIDYTILISNWSR